MVPLSDSEHNLQTMLTSLNIWCVQWYLSINVLKSSIVHFRPKSCHNTIQYNTIQYNTIQYKLTYGSEAMDYVNSYTDLGIVLDEHLTLSNCISRKQSTLFHH